MEPFYLRQNADGLTGDEMRQWFIACRDEALAAGAVHARASRHQDQGWLLFEAWKETPRTNGELCEGEPRWQVHT